MFCLLCRNLQRYIHYNSRWEAHVASQNLETKQVAEIKEKIIELEDNGTELKDYTWLSQVITAVFLLIIFWSYLLAFQLQLTCWHYTSKGMLNALHLGSRSAVCFMMYTFLLCYETVATTACLTLDLCLVPVYINTQDVCSTTSIMGP